MNTVALVSGISGSGKTFTAADFAVFRGSGVKTLALGHGPANYEAALRWTLSPGPMRNST